MASPSDSVFLYGLAVRVGERQNLAGVDVLGYHGHEAVFVELDVLHGRSPDRNPGLGHVSY